MCNKGFIYYQNKAKQNKTKQNKTKQKNKRLSCGCKCCKRHEVYLRSPLTFNIMNLSLLYVSFLSHTRFIL